MVIERGSLPSPLPPAETVQCEELGGEVVVRGLDLRGHLQWSLDNREDRFGQVSRLLSLCVFAADQKPLWTAEQWEAWGARNRSAAFDLFSHCRRLSGLDEAEAEKK